MCIVQWLLYDIGISLYKPAIYGRAGGCCTDDAIWPLKMDRIKGMSWLAAPLY